MEIWIMTLLKCNRCCVWWKAKKGETHFIYCPRCYLTLIYDMLRGIKIDYKKI